MSNLYKIATDGIDGSGKTHLTERLISNLSEDYSLLFRAQTQITYSSKGLGERCPLFEKVGEFLDSYARVADSTHNKAIIGATNIVPVYVSKVLEDRAIARYAPKIKGLFAR